MAPNKEEDRPRQKKWATKVRTGCLTCRSRRIKCDEEKPACKKCTSTGRVCEGYPVKKSTKGKTTPKALVALVPRASPEIIVPNVRELAYSNGPPGVNTTPEGRFIMHFFRREACPNIGGAIDKRFWSVDLQQATDTHPIMWYSSAAFAALYLRRNEKRYSSFKVATGDFLDTFALSQYNHAIRCAIQMASQPHLLSIDQKQAFLMSSLIFTGIGYLNGNTDEALTHLRNGLRLFSMWKFDKQLHENIGSQSLLSAKSLIMLFRRFTTQSLHLRDESWPETKWTEESMDDSNDNFTTPTDAYFAIEPIYNRLVNFLGEKRRPSSSNDEPQPARDASYDVRTDFDAWKVRFADLHYSKDLDPIDQEGVLILRIREAVIEAALTINMTEYNIALDTIDVHFRTILKDADDLLELQLNSWRTGETFTFSASVCEALSFIGTSCRDAELRERAVELLRKWPLMDGAYDAGLLARVSAAYGDAYGRIEDADTDASQLGSGIHPQTR